MTARTARHRTIARLSTALLAAVAIAYFTGFKRGWYAPSPTVFAAIVLALVGAVAGLAVGALVRAVRSPRLAAAGEVLALGGLLAVGIGGLANWAFGLQGAAIAFERQPVRLSGDGQLAELVAGPLADRRELDVTIGLARLRLVGSGPEHFRAVSSLKVLDAAGEEVGLTVERSSPARHGPLVFHQGAFGFAPRIVVRNGDRLAHDAHVPFRTVREGPGGLAFVGDVELESEKLRVDAAVTLEDLNDEMKGHPRLELTVSRAGASIGQGTLRPGEFAKLADGWEVGFAGLRRWSEIDFSRRNYSAAVRLGAAAFALGLLLWPLAAWRRW